MFGYVTIVCILLAIFRRLILLAFDAGSVDWWHCACGPWYADLYLLGLDGLWGFGGDVNEITSPSKTYGALYALTTISSAGIWLVIHIMASIFTGIALHKLFFKPTETA
jgi:hypothetical protein